MSIVLPSISGTAHDGPLNEFISIVNDRHDLEFTAHAVCAIFKFLVESDQLPAAKNWMGITFPLTKGISINPYVADQLCERLRQRTERPIKQRGGFRAVGVAVVVGLLLFAL